MLLLHAQQYRTPGKAAAKRFHQDQLARFDTAITSPDIKRHWH